MIAQPFIGICRDTGAPIAGRALLEQCIKDILTTRLGSRRMRPLYGSRIPDMVDMPFNAGLKSAMQAEIAHALNRPENWSRQLTEPLILVRRVTLVAITDGRISMVIDAEINGDAQIMELST